MRDTTAPARRLSGSFADSADARRLACTSLACNAVALVHLCAAAAGVLPAWTLLLSMPVLVPRWMIAVHELFHLRSEREVDPFTRRLPLPFTLLSVGYREQLHIHRSHHRHMATPADAEFYQLRGSPLRGFANAFTAPEQTWFRWVAARGIDGPLVRDTVLRLVLFAALAGATAPVFLWYWLPARVAYGASYFVFFYALHRRGDSFGAYPLQLPPALAGIAALIWGRDVVDATLHHDIHHRQPRIAARNLGSSRAALMLAQSSLAETTR